MSLDNTLFELTHPEKGERPLRHVEAVADRSAPKIEPGATVHHFDKGGFLQEIEGGCPLKHVEPDDRSEPRVAGVTLQPNPRPALLAEVKAIGGHSAVVSELKAAAEAGGPALAHVEAPADRSAPAVEGAHVGQWDKGAFLGEIAAAPAKALKHVEKVSDRSEPLVEPDVKVKPHPHGQLMQELRTSSPQALRHVEETADRSSPRVTQTAALRMRMEGH